ncbi:UNVERIFIED_CONTAM: hypothetical protein HDU68_011465 [Siphonaria sp. JEL0065]|nr:hypothetical protein HDU68_011465 [Siphonaria sp. JEL0065]
MFKPVTAEKVPLITLDDATLLLAEKESRKTVAQAKSQIVGGTINLLLLSPMAVYSIAKSSKVSRREYWSHEELIKEIERRKLTVLPKTLDESGAALVGTQVVAVALGHALGPVVAGGVVGAATTGVVSTVSHFAVSKVADNAVESVTVAATGKASEAISSKFSAGPEPVYTVPDTNTVTATTHLNGTWSGFGKSEIEQTGSDSTGENQKQTEKGFKGLYNIATDHFSHTSAVLKEAKSSASPLKTLVSGLSNSVSTTASAVVTVVTGKGENAVKEEFAVPIKYRMKFEFVVVGVKVSGKNLVDDLSVVGKCHESGTSIEWTESIPKAEAGGDSDLTVLYQAKIRGGQMVGTWTATDGRKGTFALSHL